MDLNYIYDHIMYDLVVDGTIKFHGDIDYVSSHLGEGDSNSLVVSPTQTTELQSFVDGYLAELKTNANLSIKEYFERKTI